MSLVQKICFHMVFATVLYVGIVLESVAAPEPLWREVAPENLVFVQLDIGQIVLELNPTFAPKTVRQFRRLIQERFYDGLSFYRVIDGFVAQGGDGSDLGRLSNVPVIEAEFEIPWSAEFNFQQVEREDMFADETGFIDGFAVGRDLEADTAWLTHCPGIVAMARPEGADTSRTDFYFVIGQAPRYLDRNLNVFGRVVEGMDVVQRIVRGKAADNGIIEDETRTTRIVSMTLASDIEKKDRLSALVVDTSSKGFKRLLKDRRDRKQDWFQHKPPEVLDVCQVPVTSRITK